ncbi:MAG: ATP-binding protein [Saprospirales bacterium]|nr:ATP-binding protein [Saprospirales bacterium]
MYFPGGELSLLKSKAIYGANASGKSNVVRALASMLTIICDGLKDEEVLPKRITPFWFREENLLQPSFFQIVFILDGVQYRYGFEASRERIHSEWLFGKPLHEKGVRERYYFTREDMDISINEIHFKEGARLQENAPLFRENSLFLAVSAAFNGPLAQRLLSFFRSDILTVLGIEESHHLGKIALQAMSDPIFVEKATRLLQAVDPGIQKLARVEEQVILFRSRYDAAGK